MMNFRLRNSTGTEPRALARAVLQLQIDPTVTRDHIKPLIPSARSNASLEILIAFLALSVSTHTLLGRQGQSTPPDEHNPANRSAAAQGQGDPQATIPATTAGEPEAKAVEQLPLSAVAIEVGGSVEWALSGVDVLAKGGWTPLKVGHRLLAGEQIRTGLRSFVTLKFGETTMVSVRSATHASIDQFYRSTTSETTRIGLGYGTVRGGSTESTVYSDVIVDAPVATLAKRGTEGWQIQVEPGTGRFTISLAREGLVEAIQKLSTDRQRSKLIRPGEYTTEDSIAKLWINQMKFDRQVKFYEPQGLSSSDVEFTQIGTGGLDVVAPGGGSEVVDLSQRVNASFVLDQIQANNPSGLRTPTMAIIQPGPVLRPEGTFGTPNTFQVLVPRSLSATRVSGK